MIDTIVLEFVYVTNIIDHYIPGYWFIALVGAMFYIVITFSMGVPTIITERVEYMPAFVILF